MELCDEDRNARQCISDRKVGLLRSESQHAAQQSLHAVVLLAWHAHVRRSKDTRAHCTKQDDFQTHAPDIQLQQK
eukprot:4638580-Amphidinium_carterae.1